MIGQKGIPARFGGIETHVDQISTRLAARGHEVSVFCRNRFKPEDAAIAKVDGLNKGPTGFTYKGVRLVYRPSVPTKHLDAASHTFFCALETAFRRSFDIVHFHGIGPSAFAPVARLGGQTVVSTIHALDWRQVKWGKWAKRALLKGEETAIRSSRGVIAVSEILRDYIGRKYGVSARYIPNGATILPIKPPNRIKQIGLEGGDYILTVGRIIPDRGVHTLLKAFASVDTPLKLVVVGSEMPRTDYSRRLEEMADDRVIFTGDLYGEVLEELYSNAHLYVLASEVEGLPITVCEAMGFGRCALLSDIPENSEVGGDVAVYFKTNDVSDLRFLLQELLKDSTVVAERGRRGRERIEERFNWDRVTDEVEQYYLDLL